MDAMHIGELEKTVLLVLMAAIMQLEVSYGATILMASAQFRSHVISQASVGEELLQRGHEVYLAVGSRYPKSELKSLEQHGLKIVTYHIPSDAPFQVSDEAEKEFAEFIFSPMYDVVNEAKMWSAQCSRDCEYMLLDNKFLEQVGMLKFDMALVEPFILNPCVMLLPYNLNIPFISLTSMFLPWHLHLPALPSFFHLPSPGPFTVGSEPTLWNSFVSTLLYLWSHSVVTYQVWNDTLLHHCSSGHATSWTDVILKSELFIIDNDHHLGSHLPLFPNVIRLSGATIRPAKPLPDKLEKLIGQSHDGVILFSFGSIASYYPKEVIVKFLETFSHLNQTVFAKLIVPDGVKVPENVHVLGWLPQNDILGHRQTRLFITHCGSNGQHEALYHGVPMLGFPLFAEQSSNCDRACDKGFGLRMNIHNFTSVEMLDNVQELLNNEIYRDNVKQLSAIMRDEPLIGPKKAAHWIEHVVKYGSSHLRSSAMDMPLYKFLMLDVLALLAVIAFVTMCLSCTGILVLYRTFCKTSIHKEPGTKKLQ